MDNNTNGFNQIDDEPIDVLAQRALNLGVSIGLAHPDKAYELINNAFAIYPDITKIIKKNEDYVYNPANEEIVGKCPICHTDAAIATPYYCAFSFRMSNFGVPFAPAKLWMKCETCGNLFTFGWAKSFLHPTVQPQKTLLPIAENKNLSYTEQPRTLYIYNNILTKSREYTDGRKLLEVGIGKGELAAVALELGYDVTLVEIDEDSGQIVADMLNTPVICTDFLQYQTEEKFDVIIMGDVLEHVTDPHAAMDKARELLADGSVIWLSTPNFESSFTKIMKFNDPMFMEPYHITWFNKRGIEALLDDCGLKIIEYKVSKRYNGSMELFIVKK
jgi:SAM-dependent methyltransferase